MTIPVDRTDRRPAAAVPDPEATPAHRGRLVLLSVVLGLLVTAAWSAPFVDKVIGENIADTVVGHDAAGTSIAGSLAGLLFAFAAGLAGTFTACNIAAFSAMAPMAAGGGSTSARMLAALRPIGWLAVGLVPVAIGYGAIGAVVGTGLPQLSTDTVGAGQMPVRLLQSIVVFGLIGVVFVYLGLAALRIVPDPLARLTARWPQTPMVVMGVLIALFLVGRPYPLFMKMFRYAAENGNPFFGGLTFLLAAIGNIVIMAALFVLLSVTVGGRFQRWLAGGRGRVAAVTGTALLVAGVFTVLYWDVRLLAHFGYGWFPRAPWT